MDMIIVYGGCQADDQLSAEAGDKLSARIPALSQSLKQKGFVGSLARGADFVFAGAPLAAGGKDDFVEVLLPFDEATFRTKVADPAGEPWISDYDRIPSTASVKVDDAG